jgi:hypothetical protein
LAAARLRHVFSAHRDAYLPPSRCRHGCS